MKRATWSWVVMAAFWSVAAVQPACAAPPPAPQFLPESTVVMVRIANATEFAEKWQETTIGRMAKDEQLRPFLKHLYGSALEAFLVVEEEVGVSLTDVLKIPQGEICFAVVAGESNRPGLLVYMDCGDNIRDAQKLLDRALEEAVKNSEVVREQKVGNVTLNVVGGGDDAVCVFVKDTTVMLTTGVELAQSVIEVWDGKVKDVATLADNKTFTSIMKKCAGSRDEPPQASFFLDPMGLVRVVTRGNVGAQVGMALLSPLGLYGIQGMGGSMILVTEDFDSILHAHLLLENPREGVLKVLAMKSGDPEPEDWVPENVVSYSTMHWDMQQSLTALGEIYDQIRGEGALQRDIQRRISDQLGIDFQQEVLGQLSGRFTMASWMEKPIKLNSGCVMIGVEVDSPKKMRETLDTLADKFSENITPASYSGLNYYRLQGPRGRRDNQRPGGGLIRIPEPLVAVVGDYLIFSDSVKFLETALSAKGSGKSLANDLEFKLIDGKIRRQLGGAEPGLMSFNRPEESLKAIYSLATAPEVRMQLETGAAGNPVFRALHEALQENPLPPFSVLSKYLAPGGAMMVDDETGIHYTAFGLKRE